MTLTGETKESISRGVIESRAEQAEIEEEIDSLVDLGVEALNRGQQILERAYQRLISLPEDTSLASASSIIGAEAALLIKWKTPPVSLKDLIEQANISSGRWLVALIRASRRKPQ